MEASPTIKIQPKRASIVVIDQEYPSLTNKGSLVSNPEMVPYNSFKKFRDSMMDSQKSLKLREQYLNNPMQVLTEINYESCGPEELQDHFRLID